MRPGLSGDEVLQELKHRGLERPMCEDALYFGVKHPEEQRKRPIVFLHEPVRDPNGNLNVLVLREVDGYRYLHLRWFGDRWGRHYVFAGVRHSLYFLPPEEAGVSFAKYLFHPPSIFPISYSDSESAIYFLLSSALISHAICKKNFSTSSFTNPVLI